MRVEVILLPAVARVVSRRTIVLGSRTGRQRIFEIRTVGL